MFNPLLIRQRNKFVFSLSEFTISIYSPPPYAGYTYDLHSLPDHSLKGLEYLDLDRRFNNIPLAPRATRDLVCLDKLGTDGFSAEVFERVGLDCVDAQLGVGLDNGKAAGYLIGIS